MKKMSLVLRLGLLQYAIEEIKALGFTKKGTAVESYRYNYYKQTSVGEIGITPKIEDYGIAFYAMFDNVQLAKTKFDCNPFSGKHNHLFLVTKDDIRNVLSLYKDI
ncbi:MAG: hypothetical protein M0R03_20705 [Novosphingobium sp.]|nr:hypothetical protein [Novosphingobium sp.]